MSKGILIFSHNNNQIDYTKIAICSSLMAKKQLNVPVCLVTDSGSWKYAKESIDNALLDKCFDDVKIYDNIYDKIITRTFVDGHGYKGSLPWYNNSRIKAYELSPFDQTLLIDSDFLMLDNSLSNCWDNSEDFLVNSSAIRLNREKLPNSEIYISDSGPKMYWATVMYFKKSKFCQILFDLVNHIYDNYSNYQFLYKLPSKLFRGDFALSIALHMLNNFDYDHDIKPLPDPLLTAWIYDELYDISKDGELIFLLGNENEWGPFKVQNINTNIHILNKFSIIRNYEKIVRIYND